MRFLTAISLFAVVLVVFFSPCKAAANQYVQISDPFVNVYAELDPKSPVIKMAKKGDRLELNYAGASWYNVKIRDKDGWVERRAGRLVEGTDIFSYALSIVLILIALIGTIYGVSMRIKKQKTV
jgi:uncharacterized protein YraI